MIGQPSKKLIAQGLYAGGYLRVLFDPKAAAAVIPDYLRASTQAAFDYGESLARPPADVVIDDDGIQATLSFNFEPFLTVLPWAAVFCMLSPHHGTVAWPSDVPASVVDAHEPAPAKTPEAPVKKPRPAWLKAVE